MNQVPKYNLKYRTGREGGGYETIVTSGNRAETESIEWMD
jgi:hypothetical protein